MKASHFPSGWIGRVRWVRVLAILQNKKEMSDAMLHGEAGEEFRNQNTQMTFIGSYILTYFDRLLIVAQLSEMTVLSLWIR